MARQLRKLISVCGYYERQHFVTYGQEDPVVVSRVSDLRQWLDVMPIWDCWITDFTLLDSTIQPVLDHIQDRYSVREPLLFNSILVTDVVLEDGAWTTLFLHKLGYKVTHIPDNFPENSIYARTIGKAISDRVPDSGDAHVLNVPTVRDPDSGRPWTWKPGQPTRPHW